ncbi:MAG TPA: response regulator transcription factor [Gemmatimonadaceae bacterium]|nr:response regulator transcription factor [Gemmatimonadaceae bacterium]
MQYAGPCSTTFDPRQQSLMFAIAPEQRVRSILVIDDEPQIRRAVRNALAPLSERVLEAATAVAGLDLAASARPDLIVLDLALPDMEGEEVCRDIRLWSRMPIIVLSARDSEDEKVKLLRAGADDYITKPFGLRELEARVQVQLRRVTTSTESGGVGMIELGDIRIDFNSRRVTHGSDVEHLTPIEWKLLRALSTDVGRTLTHRQIFDAVWGRPFGNPQQYLRVHITKLRRKIEPDPSNPVLVVTEPGIGYRFELPTESR